MTSDVTGEQGRGKVTKVLDTRVKNLNYLKDNMKQRFLR